MKIIDYGVMLTPALVINEEVKVVGRVPSKEEIAGWIKGGNAEGEKKSGCSCGSC
jgi:hypothetical protein